MTSSVFIEGREWFDKSAGNTYYSARLWVDGSVVAQLPRTYGGRDKYYHDSVMWLVANGYLPEHRTAGDLRKSGIALYRTVTPSLKRDLFRAWTPDED